jgi:hypothetical protein
MGVWQRFRDAGWLERVKALRVILTQRTPPWQLRVNSRNFRGLDGAISVEVEVIYDIDLTGKVVTFRRFESFSPDSHDEVTANHPGSW